MTGFDVVSRLFGLLLGLGLAEVLGGFARVWRTKTGATDIEPSNVRVGALVPLLGLLVIVDQTGFWIAFYDLRNLVPFNYATLLTLLAIVGTFYAISTFVIPSEIAHWLDFDAYYFRVRRIVAGGMIGIHVATLSFAIVLIENSNQPFKNETGVANVIGQISSALFVPILIALMASSKKRTQLVLLIVANALLLAEAFTFSR
jgi:hypothetical protein